MLGSCVTDDDEKAPWSEASISSPSRLARRKAVERVAAEEKAYTEDLTVTSIATRSRSSSSLTAAPTQDSGELQERREREEMIMKGRVDEAKDQLTYDAIFDLRERERAMAALKNTSVLLRDVQTVRRRMRGHGRLLINQNSPYAFAWDVLIILALLYTMFVTPFEIGFLSDEGLVWATPANTVITVLFTLDIIKEFFVPYRLSPKEGGGIVRSHRRIAINYLSTWAPLDIVATVPIDLIVGAISGGGAADALKVMKILRLTRLLRLGRLLRTSRVVTRLLASMERFFILSSVARSVIFWFGVMFIVFHWLACVWGLVAKLRSSQRTAALTAAVLSDPANCAPGEGSCLSPCEMDLLVELHAAQPEATRLDRAAIEQSELWLCRAILGGKLPSRVEEDSWGLYVIVMAELQAGFEIIQPRATSEHGLRFLTSFGNMIFNSFFLGVVFKAMSQSSPMQRAFNERMDYLNHYLRECGAPPQLKARARDYLRNTKDLEALKSFDAIYPLFSPMLQGDLYANLTLSTLRVVPYFAAVETAFLRSLSRDLSRHGFEAGECITHLEATLNIVTRGTAVRSGKPITRGQYWGADSVLMSSSALRDNRPASALTYLEIISLQRTDLVKSMDKYPRSAHILRGHALKIAMTRAPLLISRYFELKAPKPAIEALRRRHMKLPGRLKRSYLGTGVDGYDGSSPASCGGMGASGMSGAGECSGSGSPPGSAGAASGEGAHGDASSVSSEDSDVFVPSLTQADRDKYMWEQARHFGRSLRNLGKAASVQHREFHEVMRIVNGGEPLRGFARDQRKSEDSEMRLLAIKARKQISRKDQANDDERLILDEHGNVVDANGKTVFVQHLASEEVLLASEEARKQAGRDGPSETDTRTLSAVRTAVRELGDHLATKMNLLVHDAVDDLRLRSEFRHEQLQHELRSELRAAGGAPALPARGAVPTGNDSAAAATHASRAPLSAEAAADIRDRARQAYGMTSADAAPGGGGMGARRLVAPGMYQRPRGRRIAAAVSASASDAGGERDSSMHA